MSANLFCIRVVRGPYHSLDETFTHQLQVFIRDLLIYLSMVASLNITMTERKKDFHFVQVFFCRFEKKRRERFRIPYLHPFPIQVKPCYHHSLCKLMLLLSLEKKELYPISCIFYQIDSLWSTTEDLDVFA